jgi:hypothetical protein
MLNVQLKIIILLKEPDIPCQGLDIPCQGTPGDSGLHTQAHWYPHTSIAYTPVILKHSMDAP